MSEVTEAQETGLEISGAAARKRIRQLEQRLADADATIDALLAGEVDAVVESETSSPRLLYEAQKALVESENKLRAVFDGALDAIVMADDDGVYVEANAAAGQLLGLEPQELVGRHINEFFVGDFEPIWDNFLGTRGDVDRGGVVMRRTDGELRYVEYAATADVLPGRHLSILRDVTERRRMEQEREEALAQLKERIKELTLLHYAGHLLSVRQQTVPDLLQSLVELIPPGWQFPQITAARITYGDVQAQSENYRYTDWQQEATFEVAGEARGSIEVAYLEERPQADEGPFLAEERRALDALVHMLQNDLERRQVQAELEHSEARYRQLFETMVQGVLYQDTEGRIIDANPAAAHILKVDLEELVGTNSTDPEMTMIDEDGASIPVGQTPGDQALASGEPVHDVVVGVSLPQQKEFRWLRVQSIPQFESGKEAPSQVYSTFEDITQRRRAEERYRQLFDTMVQGVTYQNAQGQIVDANTAAERILGLSRDELLGRTSVDPRWHAIREDGSPFPGEEHPSMEALHTGRPVRNVVMGVYHPGQGAYRWIDINAIPQLRPGDEAPFGVYSTFSDITERKQAEERRRQLAAIVDSSEDAIIGQKVDGTIVSWNRGAEKTYGYSAEEAIGKHITLLAPPERREEMVKIMRAALEGKATEGYDTVRRQKDGSKLMVSLSVAPIRDDGGRVTGVSSISRDVSRQKKAEAALRFQAKLLGSVREAVVATNMEKRIIYWGKGAEELYGYTRQEALGRSLSDLVPVPGGATRKEILDVVSQDKTWRGEMQHESKDGKRFWVQSTVSMIRDRRGQPLGLIGIDRDVTAQRQYEKELEAVAQLADALRTLRSADEVQREVLAQLVNLLQAQSAATILADPSDGTLRVAHVFGQYQQLKGMVVEANQGITGRAMAKRLPQIVEHLGRETEFAGSHLFGDDAAACIPLISHEETIGAIWIVRGPAFRDEEMRMMTAVGDMAGGAIHRATLFQRVQEQAQRVERIMNTVTDGMLLLDEEQRVLLANPAAVSHLATLSAIRGGAGAPQVMSGTRIEDFQHRPIVDLLQALRGKRIEELGGRSVADLLRAPSGQEQEITVKEPKQHHFEVAAHALSAGEESGGAVLVLRDVTEARHNQEMLQQQERLAAVGQLAAGIAHDFNNVMSSIVLYAQILQRHEGLTEKERRRLDVIYSQANYATKLIRQILDFSRRSVMERSALDMGPFFKELFKLWERTLPENIALDLHYDENEYVVMADPTRLQQAMTNLAVNARDAMPRGGSLAMDLSHLTLAAEETPPAPDMLPGDWLRITVTDTGNGIAAEDLPHIFEPFFSTKKREKGTGLGLAQVYGIVRQHEGYITVDSTPGQGTAFDIYLPLLLEAGVEEDQRAPDVAGAARARGEATVLVVEDEEWALEAMQETLEALDYHVLTASDGRQALDLFRECEQVIDLVLSDMVMPEMGGEELYEQIRRQHPGIKMIIMSGYPLDDDGHSLLERGIVDWIAKPFTVNALADKIAEVLES